MGKIVGAVLAGYVSMFITIFVSFSAAFLVMGTDGAFQPESFEPSVSWLLVSFVLGFLAALEGGFICALIGGESATNALSAFVVVLGLLMAIPVMLADVEPLVRATDLANLEAMQQARTPVWVAVANPFLGAIGVLLGGRLKDKLRKK